MGNRITLITVLLICCSFFISNAQTVTVNCRTTAGGAGQITSAGVFTDPLTGAINISSTTRGYAVFDVSGIPANASITSVSVVVSTSRGGTGSFFVTNITGDAADWSTQSGTSLYSTISSAAIMSNGSWGTSTTPASNTIAMNAATALVQNHLNSTISLGFYVSGTRTFTIAGETSTAPPQLLITYIILAKPKYASLPYTQNFESWVDFNSTTDAPDSNWTNSPPTGTTTWRRDDQGSSAGWVVNSNAYDDDQYVAPQGSHFARFNVYAPNGTTGTLDLHVNCSGGNSSKQVSFFYVNKETDNMDVSLSTDSGKTFTLLNTYTAISAWTQFNVPFTSNATGTVIRFAATSNYGNYDMGLDNVTVTTLNVCSGTPAQGVASPSKAFILPCSPTQTFTLTGNYSGVSGITYQWQQSTNGTTFTPILNATSASYTGTFTSNVFVNCVVTCSATSLSSTSNKDTLIAGEGYYAVGASTPYVQGFENSWISRCATNDAPDSYWLGTPSTGDQSWRRDDDGASANWDDPTLLAYTPTGNNSSHSARFHASYNYNTSGSLDLYLDLSAPGTKQLSYDFLDYGGGGNMTVSISTTGPNGTFTQLDLPAKLSQWKTRTVTTTATSSTCVLRFTGTGDYNEELGIDNINVSLLNGCAGAPAATVAAPSKVALTQCNAVQAFTLPTNPNVGIGGITYQWQQSTNGTTFTPIAGATSATLTDTFSVGTTYINCLVTCINSGQSTASTIDTVTMTAPSYVAVTAGSPYVQGFENAWGSKCGTDDAPDNYWIDIPGTGASSWRRDDDGASASWFILGGNVYSPAGSNANGGSSSHSARFHNGISNQPTGRMDLYLNLSASGTKQISYDYINASTSGSNMTVWLSTTGPNGTFTQLDTITTSATWVRRVMTTTATSSTCVLRFKALRDFDGDDIGLDNVSVTVLVSCSGKPAQATIFPSHPILSTCSPAQTFALGNTYAGVGGLTYQWQRSADGVTFTPVQGATGATYTGSFNSTGYINCLVTCPGSGQSTATVTDTVTIASQAYATIPYTEDFENTWANICGTDKESPDTYWSNSNANTVTTTDLQAWRRSDNTVWGGGSIAAFTPYPSGSYSARFHTESTIGSGISDSSYIDLHVNCKVIRGSKKLSFYYNNNGGSDYMNVFISVDSGLTFTRLGTYTTTSTGWEKDSLPVISSSPKTIIRFSGVSVFSNDGGSDIGLDLVSIFVCGGGTGIIASGPLTICSGDSVLLSADTTMVNNTFQWLLNDNGINSATKNTYAAHQAGIYTVAIDNISHCPDTSFADTIVVRPAPVPVVTELYNPQKLSSATAVTYQWYLNGQPLSGDTSQSVTPTVNGIYYVVVTDANGCSGRSVDYTLADLGVADVAEHLQDVTLYPDPNTGSFVIKGAMYGISKKDVSFEITNMLGQVIYQNTKLLNKGAWEQHVTLDNNIANGVYMLRVQMDEQSQVMRFIVNK